MKIKLFRVGDYLHVANVDMDRKRPTAASAVLENQQEPPIYLQFADSESKRLKLAPDLPYSIFGDIDHQRSPFQFSGELPEDLHSSYHRRTPTPVNETHQLKNEVIKLHASSSSNTNQSRRIANFSDYNAGDNVISVVDIADSPDSRGSFTASDDEANEPLCDGLNHGDPRYDNRPHYNDSRCDKSVECLENEDIETDIEEEAVNNGSEMKSFDIESVDTENSARLSNPAWDEHVTAWMKMSHELSDKQRTVIKSRIRILERQFSCQAEEKIKSERAITEDVRNQLENLRRDSDWQKSQIRYLEVKLQERNEFEFKLETVKEQNEKLEKRLDKYKKAALDLSTVEKELRRMQDKVKLLEEDKQSKEELGQTVSNLIDENGKMKTEIESLSSIAEMLEKENSTLKQKCEDLENENAAGKATAAALQNCAGDDVTNENCCLRIRELKDKILEMIENEFKCSICEEIFIDASVTSCNHVFCAHCLSEWMKKKKDCPHCRMIISQQCRAPVIDEFVLNICKVLSDKMHDERVQIVNERKAQTHSKVPPQQPSSRKSPNGSVRVVPLSTLYSDVPSNSSAFMRTLGSSSLPYRTPQSTLTGYRGMNDLFYPNDDFFSGASSTGVAATSTPSTSSRVPMPLSAPSRMPMPLSAPSASTSASGSLSFSPPLALDARSRTHTSTALQSLQSALSALPSSSMRASSSSSPLPSSGLASSTAATNASSASSPYPFSWTRFRDPDPIMTDPYAYMPPTAQAAPPPYNPSRPTLAAVNPFSMNDYSTSAPMTSSGQQQQQQQQQPISSNQVGSSSSNRSSLAYASQPQTQAQAQPQSRSDLDHSFNVNWNTLLRPKTITQLQQLTRGCNFISPEQIYEAELKLFLKAKSEDEYKTSTRRLLRLVKDKIILSRLSGSSVDDANILQMIQSV